MQKNDGDVRTMVAIHRADPDKMREWQGVVDKYPVDTAIADKDINWDGPFHSARLLSHVQAATAEPGNNSGVL